MGKINNNSSISKENRQKKECIILRNVNKRSLEANLDSVSLSGFGGLPLLREEERVLSLSEKLASCITDSRKQYLVHHSLEEIIRTRLFQLCLGYEDVNDCDLNRKEPMMRLMVGDSYDKGICSSATMCRFENMVTDDDLLSLQEMFVTIFILSYKGEEPKDIILDCDDTNVDCYGAQEQTLFNNYYMEYCYMPLLIFEGHSGKLIQPLLRPGRRNKTANINDTLQWLIAMLRTAWPNTFITVRGDSHFCSHEFMDWVTEGKDKRSRFITGLSSNSVLDRNPEVKRLQQKAIDHYKRTGLPKKYYGELRYKAGTWNNEQRVIVKAEITNSGGLNTRYIVTNFNVRTDVYGLPWSAPMYLYEKRYCARGKDELYIREFKEAVNGDRLSCHAFKANSLRTFMHAAAYVLMHSLRERAFEGTSLEKATLLTIRERILLTAVCVKVFKTKVILDFAMYNPMADELRHALLFYRKTA